MSGRRPSLPTMSMLLPSDIMQRRKLKLKAKFEGNPSYLRFKR
jgi:hypothetical protein